ncbi:MAG: DUF2784 family protein [Fimbriimonas sp.]
MIHLVLLDWFFLTFHTALVLFNMIGWAFRRTRRMNLISLAVTAASWTLMARWYGLGYCVCTDWHWQVRRALGYHDHSSTYIQFLVERLCGFVPNLTMTKNVSVAAFLVAATLSIYLNIRDCRLLRHVKDGVPDAEVLHEG